MVYFSFHNRPQGQAGTRPRLCDIYLAEFSFKRKQSLISVFGCLTCLKIVVIVIVAGLKV